MKRYILTTVMIAISILPSVASAYNISGRYHWPYGNPASAIITFDNSVPFTWNTALSRSMNAWNNAGAKFRLYNGYAGHVVSYHWVNESLTLGITNTYASGTTIYDDDTIINSRFRWATNGDPNAYDVQSVVTHELGHWLRPGDVGSSWDRSQSAVTLFYSTGVGDISHRTLEPDDISGIRAVYGT